MMGTTIIINQIVERPVLRHIISATIAICVFGPLLYLSTVAREPPWVRLRGEISPTHAGGQLAVKWHTTPLVRACPGTLQIEIISRDPVTGRPLIWPFLSRPVSNELVIGQTEYDTPPWPLFSDIPPGPATYRVTSFWFCNKFQKQFNWPIVQVGPDIQFTVLPEEK